MERTLLKMKHPEYTIGGLRPEGNPYQKYSQALGNEICKLSSKKWKERRTAYIEIMRIRRHFTIDQWSEFSKQLDKFRVEHSMLTFSQLMVNISQEMIKERPSVKAVLVDEFPYSSENKTYNLIEKEQNTMKSDLSTSVLKIIALCFITMGEEFLKLFEVDGLETELKKDQGKKPQKSKIKEPEPEPQIDFMAKCREIAGQFQQQKEGLKAFKTVLSEAGFKGLKSIPEKELPKIYEKLEKALTELKEMNSLTEGGECEEVDKSTDINYRQECREIIKQICAVVDDLEPLKKVYTSLGVKGLNSAPEEMLPELYAEMKKVFKKVQAEKG